jgi:hypothetical protein
MTKYTIERWVMMFVLGVLLWPFGRLLMWMKETFYALPDDEGIRGSRFTLDLWAMLGVRGNTSQVKKFIREGQKVYDSVKRDEETFSDIWS